MQSKVLAGLALGMMAVVLSSTAPAVRAQSPQESVPVATPQAADDNDPVRMLVGRLDLEKYKATIKGLTQFGDRRQGTDRNRAAIDWIEAQLKSYGCTNTERIKYDYQPAGRARHGRGRRRASGGRRSRQGRRTRRGRSGGADSAAAGADARVRAAAPSSAIAAARASTTIPTPRPTPSCASSTRSRARRACASRSTARRSARPGPTRCTSSAGTWTVSGSGKRPTTTAPEPPW